MKYFRVIFIIFIILCITTCYCSSFSVKPKGKISPGASESESEGYQTPDRVRIKHTKAPLRGHSTPGTVVSKPLNPLQIKHTPTPSSEEKSISEKPAKKKKSNTIYIIAGLIMVVLALAIGGLVYYNKQAREF